MKRKLLSILLAFVLVTITACSNAEPTKKPDATESLAPAATEPSVDSTEAPTDGDSDSANSSKIILATTTSTQDSGLLDEIVPMFTEKTGIEVSIISVGTGQAIKMGEDGDADVLLVHDTPSEEKFVEEGHSDKRQDVMYNDFILLGPTGDKDGIAAESGNDIVSALKTIADKNLVFVSRGDDSGTHKTELRLWVNADIDVASPDNETWYQSVGKGMGDTLQMASEQAAYTISDRATYLKMKDNLDLEIIVQGDETLFNQYGVLVVNPDKNDQINNEGAILFAEWIVSPEGQQAISEFVEPTSGEPLFTVNAK